MSMKMLFTKHALERMNERNINLESIRIVIEEGIITRAKGIDCFKRIHHKTVVVCKRDEEDCRYIVIITVYRANQINRTFQARLMNQII